LSGLNLLFQDSILLTCKEELKMTQAKKKTTSTNHNIAQAGNKQKNQHGLSVQTGTRGGVIDVIDDKEAKQSLIYGVSR